jgi:Ca-activated chloride channel family protein
MADDVKIQVEFNPALVQEYRLIGYESRVLNAEDFNNDKVDAGDVGAGKTVTALYELVPAGEKHETDVPDLKYSSTQSTGDASELCTVSVRYKEINSGKTGSESKLVEKPVLAEDYHEIPDDNTALAISLAEAGMVIRDSEYKGSATLTSARAIAGAVAADTGSDLARSWADLLRTLIEQSE